MADTDQQSEWPSPAWTFEADQAFCRKKDIKFSVLSLTSPGPGVAGTPEGAAEIANDANMVTAEIRDQHPQSYGFFASIPPPTHMDAALAEMAFAFDNLHADGITILSSYDGKYLGHSDFAPLWQELNARKAVVFIHPTSPAGWKAANDMLLAPVIDFAWETTRCALDMILSDTLKIAPNCKIILSHAGGCLPWIWNRPAVLLQPFPRMTKSVDEIREEARSFWFDTALSGSPDVMGLLMKFAKKDRILFGSDYPYADEKTIEVFTAALDGTDMSAEMREGIAWRNAVELFPKLQNDFQAAPV